MSYEPVSGAAPRPRTENLRYTKALHVHLCLRGKLVLPVRFERTLPAF